MTYTAILNSEIDPDSPLTTGLMTKVRDNPIAMFAKDAGAPVLANLYVTEAMLAASAVSQSKLKSTTGAVSTAVDALLALPGGEYGFYPQLKSNAGATYGFHAKIFDGTADYLSTSYVTTIYLTQPASWTIYAQQRYIQSSPPYNLGHGEIPLFIFMLLERETLKVSATYVAQDPPWANNGRTKLDGDLHIGDKKYKKLSRFRDEKDKASTGLAKGDILKVDGVEYLEITTKYKNADMLDIPHPFIRYDKTKYFPVLLNPHGELCNYLITADEQGRSIPDILTDGVTISPEPMEYNTPAGVTMLDGVYSPLKVKETPEMVEVKPSLTTKLKTLITKGNVS